MKRASTVGAASGLMLFAALILSTPVRQATQAGQRVEPPKSEQPAIDEFQKAVNAYIQLRSKATSGIMPVSKDATPQQLDDNQRRTIQAVTTARSAAKPGDVFRPAFQEHVRRQLKGVFSQPDGKAVRSSILDENPVGTVVRINGPYPDVIPLTTMPPQVLEVLPKLPKDLEYRFVGDRLILFDSHAHMVVDYVDRVLPGV